MRYHLSKWGPEIGGAVLASLGAGYAATSIVACESSASDGASSAWSWFGYGRHASADTRPGSGAPGRLYIWGGPGFGRIPKRVDYPEEFVKVATADDFAVACTKKGNAVAIQPPNEEQSGALQLQELHFGSRRIVDVAIMPWSRQVVAVDDKGYVVTLRCPHSKRKHAEDDDPIQSRESEELAEKAHADLPVVLKGALKRAHITSVRCGAKHCVAISRNGTAYAWGDNSKKQLGLASLSDTEDSSNVAMPESSDQPLSMQQGSLRIADAACGDDHTLLLGRDGAVYSVGDDRWAQLGVSATPWLPGHGKPRGDVRAAECIADLAVMGVACGESHSVALLKDQTVYSFGQNSFGQLGHHNMNSFAPPSPIANMQLRALQVCAGRNHTCLLSDNGDLYCIGDGDAGQLGPGPAQRVSVWRRVKKLHTRDGKTVITAVAAGGATTAAIVSETDAGPTPA